MIEQAEQLKRVWTDKYVVVDGNRAELARFDGLTGRVRTVNMSCRCLVEFDAYNNIAWYDIDPRFLTVVDKPDPNAPAVVKKRSTDAPDPAAQPTAAEKKPAAAPAAKSGRPSVADILAAARGDKGGSAPPAAEKTESASAAVAPAPKPKAAAAPKKAAAPAGGSLPTDTAGRVAWCREHDKR